MSGKDDTPTPTPILEEVVKSTTDKHDPKTITDRFTILDKIGSGGMGRVYSALDSRLNRTVAIKILSHDNFSQGEWLRFQREAKAASKLSHPNIVQILDFGQSDQNQPFLIMEYIQGESLTDYLKTKGPFSESDALNIISELCSAMEQAHSKNIIHRDLKPANIIVSSDKQNPRFMILDFGIAKIDEENKGVKTLTKTGQIVGSPRCISPEQAIGDKVDERSDIYSLGCIAYEMLTGSPVFEGNSSFSVIEKHIGTEAPKLCDANQINYSENVESLIAKALEKDPNDRFTSMSDFRINCLAAQNNSPQEESLFEKEEESNPIQKSRNEHSTIIYSAIAFLALTATSYMLLSNNSRTSKKGANPSKTARFPDSQMERKVQGKAIRAEAKQTLPNPSEKRETDKLLQPHTYDDLPPIAFSNAMKSVKQNTGYGLNDTVFIVNSKIPFRKQFLTNLQKKPKVPLIFFTNIRVVYEFIPLIKKFKNVNYLKFERCTIDDKFASTFLQDSKLKRIDLVRSPLTEATATAIGKSKTIKRLKFDQANLNDIKLKLLAKNRNIEFINISNNPQVTAIGLSHFSPVHKLTIKYNQGNKLLSKGSFRFIGKTNIFLTED